MAGARTAASTLASRIRAFLSPPEQRRGGGGLSSVGFGTLSSGNAVSPFLAENLSTVSACVGAISSTIGTLPAFVYQTTDAGRIEARSHPIARLIRTGPNSRQTWCDWLEMMLAQCLLWGNGLSVLEYDGAGRITGLIPVPWQNVLITLLPNGKLAYDIIQYTAPWGGTGVPRRYLDDEVWHLRDRSDDGFLGRSRLSRAPDVLGNALSLQTYTTALWRNGTAPSGVLKAAKSLTKEAAERLATSWQTSYGGSHNGARTVILEEGMDWTAVSVSPEDAEILASRRFTVEELTRVFGVPPPIVQDYSHGTFTNAAQAGLWFAQLTLLPWVKKIEAEFARSIFDPSSDCHLELDLSGLTRGDYSARWAAYQIAVQTGILDPDEIREAEGWNPRPTAPAPTGGEVVPGAGAAA